jgi:hypothetical protein
MTYSRIPKLNCQRKCQEACGPIGMTPLEWRRMGSPLPVIARDDSSVFILNPDTLSCPVLSQETGLCRSYEQRPVICRLWGVVRSMACPFGCEPERWLTDEEASRLMRDVEDAADTRKARP